MHDNLYGRAEAKPTKRNDTAEPPAQEPTLRSPAVIVLGLMLTLGTMFSEAAHATPIAPDGSLSIQLAPGGSVTSNSAGNALLIDSSITVTGSRIVFSTADVLPGVFNLGVKPNDSEVILSSGVYTNGNYALPTDLKVSIDGLVFEYTFVTASYQSLTNGNQTSLFQNFSFTGQMYAGTNSVTGQDYLGAPSILTFQFNQSGDQGGAIGYSGTIVVPANVPEPTSILMLGMGLLATTGLTVMTRLSPLKRSRRAMAL
jgi:hypothetical protein